MLRAMLETWDYDVAEVEGLLDSVIIANSERPAAVLVDGFFPMADCLAEVEKVRRDANMVGVPLIVISGFSKERVAEGVKASAAGGLQVKPLDFDALKRLLRYFSEVGGSQY
jgi:DNA-binding response OmpR family regulator